MPKPLTYHLYVGALACALLLVSAPAMAQQAGGFDDMSLEDLLSVQVVTASRSAESLSDAPGVVTTISAREIEQFGAKNLLEVLERVPGVYAIGTSGFPQGMLSIRGDAATTINNHVLILLDGRPMRESLHGGLNTPLYTAFPLESIDRVEVVRGPGSVLYGSNAYSGVINIITKDGSQGTAVSARAGFGSFDAKSFAGHGRFSTGDLSVATGLTLHSERGQGQAMLWEMQPDGEFVPTIVNPGQAFNLGQEVVGATVSATYQGLTFRSFGGFSEQSAYPSGGMGSADFRHITTDLGYSHAVMPNWDAAANVTFNYDRQLHNGADEMNRDFIFEQTNYIRPFDNTNIVVGGLLYSLYGSSEIEMMDFMNPMAPPTFIQAIEPYNSLWWSAYSQVDFRPIQPLKLIVGGQVNKVEGLDLDFVPRLGAIYNMTSEVGVKLLYGQAFRSPYAVERSINIPGMLEGNPNLNPEKVTSLDAQVFYNASRIQAAATYFNAKQRDMIIKTSFLAPGAFWPTSTYNNRGSLTIQGIELESKLMPVDGLFITGSLVYQTNEDDQGQTGTTLVPEVMGKIGVSYAAPVGVTLGVFNNYFSKPTSLYDLNPDAWVDPFTGVFDPNAPGVTAPPEAFNYLTAKMSVNVTRAFNLTGMPGISLDIYGTNLMGNNIYVSDIDLTNLAVPRQHGRAFKASLRVDL